MSTISLIATMASTEVIIVNWLQQERANTKFQPNLILGSRNFSQMNEYMVNVLRRDKNYDVPEQSDEELNPLWYQIGTQYPLDKARDHPRNTSKVEKPTILISTIFGLGMGPEFSSDIAGDGPRKRKSHEDEYDPELDKIKNRKIWMRGDQRLLEKLMP